MRCKYHRIPKPNDCEHCNREAVFIATLKLSHDRLNWVINFIMTGTGWFIYFPRSQMFGVVFESNREISKPSDCDHYDNNFGKLIDKARRHYH